MSESRLSFLYRVSEFTSGNVDWVARDNVPWRGVRAANLGLNKKAAEKFFAQCANERKQTLPFVQGNSVGWVARDNVPCRESEGRALGRV